jgi:hypothetical protein
MPLFLELRDGHSSVDHESHIPGQLGPTVGPFISVRLLRDEVRVATSSREHLLLRVADWIFYDNRFFSDIAIISSEQIGPGRSRRLQPFDPLLADFSTFVGNVNVSSKSSNKD